MFLAVTCHSFFHFKPLTVPLSVVSFKGSHRAAWGNYTPRVIPHPFYLIIFLTKVDKFCFLKSISCFKVTSYILPVFFTKPVISSEFTILNNPKVSTTYALLKRHKLNVLQLVLNIN